MSYCVNCGVKLADSEKVCPLCDTEVVNPKDENREKDYTPYPPRIEKLKKNVNKSFLGLLGTVILMIPAAVAMLFHILSGFNGEWEIYVYGALLLVFFYFLFPLFFTSRKIYLCIAIDGVSTALFVGLIAWINGGILNWYLVFGLPVTVLLFTYIDLSVLISRLKKPSPLTKTAIVLFMFAVSSVIFETVMALAFYESFALMWCWVVFAVFAVMGGTLIMINSRTGWQDMLLRRLFR